MTLDLDTRMGWPPELRLLIDSYPREVWMDHANLGPLARFWLEIHDGFRDLGGSLAAATTEFREGRLSAEAFKPWLAPRLERMLTHLHGHHQIEDHQFFPLFSAAEPRLVRGFSVLELDHESIHATIVELVGSANAFLQTGENDRDALRRAGDRYAEADDLLLRKLKRHLEDEEDLIIPLILDRTEGELGI